MKVKFKPPLPNRIKKTPWCLKFWKQHFIYYNLFLVPKYKLSKEMTCSCKEAKTVTRSTCHLCGWQGSCKMMNPSKDLHLTPHNLLSKSLRKSLFTLLWSILHLGKSHSCGSQSSFVLALWITSSLKNSSVGVENTPVTLICQNNLFYQVTALKQRGSLRKREHCQAVFTSW